MSELYKRNLRCILRQSEEAKFFVVSVLLLPVYLLSYTQISSSNLSSNVKFVNTSMHGVGHVFVEKAFQTFNLPSLIPVAQQKDPDPDFPTVKFPNPEEKGKQSSQNPLVIY